MDDLGIYIHIPFCHNKCTYCDFPAYQGLQDYYESYVHAVIQEIDYWCETHSESTHMPIHTLYFGGGTPTELSVEQLAMLMNHIHKRFSVDDDIHVTIEANPWPMNRAYLTDLLSLGVNRLSFGVQTFYDALLKVLHRTHTGQQAIETIDMAHRVGFPHINMDLIYGLPHQTLDEVRQDLERVAKLPIDHVSIYGLQVEPATYLAYQVHHNQLVLPNEDDETAMYDTIMDTLPRYGFERYEISNFAKHEAYSSHNLRYWQYKDYLGFGAGAHSFYQSVRRHNQDYVVPYINSVHQSGQAVVQREFIDTHRSVEDFCFLALRTKWGINEQAFQSRFAQLLTDVFDDVLQDLLGKQLLTYESGHYRMTAEGAKHGNYVFSQFIKDN